MRLKLYALVSAAAAAALATTYAPSARADEQLLIKFPNEHPQYHVELEPQIGVGLGGPLFMTAPFETGLRANISIVKNGFVREINNSVAIGLGAQFFFDRHVVDVVFPIVLQWNFWLSTHWSVFGEPGVAIATRRPYFSPFIFEAGGRYHFNETIALTLRVGYPDATVGCSFFF